MTTTTPAEEPKTQNADHGVGSEETLASSLEELRGCPISATEDKFEEAHYFLSRMVDEYHEPYPFRWNLNAFLQALGAVNSILETELQNVPDFKRWKENEKANLMNDPLLQRFVKSRNTVVHRGMLNRKSLIQAGLFRNYTLKLAYQYEVHLDEPSKDILARTQESMLGSILDEEHSAIGEQLGVKRSWIVRELGDEEVVSLCDKAWSRVGKLVASAHAFVGFRSNAPPEDGHNLEVPSVLLESDVDPSLLKKWNWLGD